MWWFFFLSILAITIYLLREKRRESGIPFLFQDCLKPCAIGLWARTLSLFLCGMSFIFLIIIFVYSLIGEGPLGSFFSKNVQKMALSTDSKIVSFVVDRSGSMAENMPGIENKPKIMIVQKALEKCVKDLDSYGEGTDLISLMSFARIARVVAPFSRERAYLLSSIASLTPEVDSRLNGTAIGYAIFKNVRLILACKAFASEAGNHDYFQSRSMIVITDGIEEPNPADRDHPFRSMRVQQALENAASCGVSVYYINIDRNSYKMLRVDEREALLSAVERTGGKYFEVTQAISLDQILQTIVLKESQTVPTKINEGLHLGYWLLIWAMITTSLSRLLETAILRVTR